MATICFHLDENCSNAIALGLRLRDIDVTTTPEAGLRDETDEQQIDYGLAQSRVIFTQDRDFLGLNAKGVIHAGIVYSRQGKLSIGEIIEQLALIHAVYDSEELRGKLEYL